MASNSEQELAEQRVDDFRQALGPFVVAAEATRMPIVFTNAAVAEHPIVFANDSFLKLIGYQREQVIGQPFNFLMHGAVEPDALELIRQQFEHSSETIDVEFQRADGGLVWVALCINPVYDDKGEVVQHCISFVDLSAQMKRMRRERAALHVLYEHTPGFIALTEGPEHQFTFANAAYHKLVGPRNLLGRPVEQVFPELKDQLILGDLDNVYRTGERFTGTAMPVRLQREEGADLETRFLDFICQPVREPDGSISGMFWEGHDVTEQRKGAEQIEALQSKLIHLSRVSAMGTMAATLAHELTQPLTAISNYAAACDSEIREGGDKAAIAEQLVAIGKCARRGGEIIRRMRDMSMRRRARREIFDLKQAVHESIVLVRAGAGVGISIEDRSRGGVFVEADRVQIQQVLMNIIRNACEAVVAVSGRVRVSTSTRDDMVVISVKDTGKGVSARATETLFKWSESSKPQGTGMGLSICRTILERHGGKLWLEKSRGDGACFSFSLPALAGATFADHSATSLPHSMRTTSPARLVA